MHTNELRDLITEAHARIGGSVWPNGLGFEAWGWAFTFDERAHLWCAVFRKGRRDQGVLVGMGDTPEAAKTRAEQATDRLRD